MAGLKALVVAAVLGWPVGPVVAEEASDANLLNSGVKMIETKNKDCAGNEIFKIENDRLTRVPTPDLGWSTVKGADFNAQRTVVYAVSWSSKDGHCCPTVGQSLAFSVRDGNLVMRHLRSWTERNP